MIRVCCACAGFCSPAKESVGKIDLLMIPCILSPLTTILGIVALNAVRAHAFTSAHLIAVDVGLLQVGAEHAAGGTIGASLGHWLSR